MTSLTRRERTIRVQLSVQDYLTFFHQLSANVQQSIVERWGEPTADPHVADGAFALAILPLGNVVVGIQPARGYHIDPSASYHDPDLPPPHGYLAFYAWLRHEFGAHAIVHMGKHGNLEWLPGKALALSADCFPEAVLGPLPHIYPFIVNDPGEGAQAKRRVGGGDRRSPDAASDPRRDLRAARPSSSAWSTSTTRRPASIRAAWRICAARSWR